jgi:hypothetical protein
MNEWEWRLLEETAGLDEVEVRGVRVRAGSHVLLRPRKGADIMDLVLDGKVGTVEKIEQDYEGNLQFAVVLEDDPGKDMGLLRQPGHRFFFRDDEIEPA